MTAAATEHPVSFECRGANLRGLVHVPAAPRDCGVLVVVGGPQYRVGSHRQFVLLARALAARGIPVLRFDHTGIGDSEGQAAGFLNLDPDIRSALDRLFAEVPGLRRAVLWGLCDGATAAALYAPKDPRVAGLVLLNPWIRSEATEAKTYLKSYYGPRLLHADFWRKLAGGQVDVIASLRSLIRYAFNAVRPRSADAPVAERLLASLADFRGRILMILSGRDLTAQEFVTTMRASTGWSAVEGRPATAVVEVPEADHTFSREEWRDRVAGLTADWAEACSGERS